MKNIIYKIFKLSCYLTILIVSSHYANAQLSYLTNSNNKEEKVESQESINVENLNAADTKDLLRRALIDILSEQNTPLPADSQTDTNNSAELSANPEQDSTDEKEKSSWVLSSYLEKAKPEDGGAAGVLSTNISESLKKTVSNWQYFPAQLGIVAKKIVNYQGFTGFLKLIGFILLSVASGILVERIAYFFIKKKRDSVYILCEIAKESSEKTQQLIDQGVIVKNNADEDKTKAEQVVQKSMPDGALSTSELINEPKDMPAEEERILSKDEKLDEMIKTDDDLRLTLMTKLRSILRLYIIDFLRLIAFAAGAFLVPSMLIKDDTALMGSFVTAFLTQLCIFFVFVVVFRTFIQPKCDYLRLFTLGQSEAKSLYLFVMTIFFLDTFGISSVIYLDQWGIEAGLLLVPMFFMTFLVNAYVLFSLWRSKSFIMKVFVHKLDNKGNQLINQKANIYPIVIGIGVIFIWLHWFYFLMQADYDRVKLLGTAWWLTIFFPLIDRVFFILTSGIVSFYKGDSRALKRRIGRIIKTFQIAFRYFIVLVIVFLYLSALDVSRVDAVKAILADLLTDVTVVFGLSYIIWELVHGYIEHKFPEEVNALASLDGEGSGSGATRSETIMPLIRSFLSVILIVIITLVALSSFGVEIGPLLAGAGIIGIAIGFGAQKLVQDILSGIFFLIDDAFRKGEYIEIENLRGSVEKISLRSMQLRHHLGAVQTIPYGEIKTVKNLSRDWITMKLELRFPYDTNIEAVRKIIKKVGQSMLVDEELGPSFILPLKSQGVMRVEESALIVRMKFTSKPGEQWVIRREAYSRVKEALEENGIFFAHREVFVRLPGEASAQSVPVPQVSGTNKVHQDISDIENMEIEDMPGVKTSHNVMHKRTRPTEQELIDNLTEEQRKKLKEAGAAAVSSIIAAEALKHGKLQEDDDNDFGE